MLDLVEFKANYKYVQRNKGKHANKEVGNHNRKTETIKKNKMEILELKCSNTRKINYITVIKW